MALGRIKQAVRRRLGLPFIDHTNVVFWPSGTAPTRLTSTQEMFCAWNAERLGIAVEDSRNRYLDSWKTIRNGHGGPEYRGFCLLTHNLLRVLYDDSEQDVFDAYQFHAPMHFLRMLSYPEPVWDERDPVVQGLRSRGQVTVLDFGCGLAQRSRGLAQMLRGQGGEVDLVLADIPTVRKPFLLWLGGKLGIPTTFLDCTPAVPIPPLGACDICIATEVFEHLHHPLRYLDAMHAAIRPGGLLLTNVADHRPEYMHVSPSLAPLRQRLGALGYVEILPNRLYRKPG